MYKADRVTKGFMLRKDGVVINGVDYPHSEINHFPSQAYIVIKMTRFNYPTMMVLSQDTQEQSSVSVNTEFRIAASDDARYPVGVEVVLDPSARGTETPILVDGNQESFTAITKYMKGFQGKDGEMAKFIKDKPNVDLVDYFVMMKGHIVTIILNTDESRRLYRDTWGSES